MSRIDGPGVYGSITVTTSAIEAKVGINPLSERQALTVQPIGGDIFWGYDSSVTSSTGTKIFKNQIYYFDATESLSIYLIAPNGTVDTRISEVG